ncbi:Protein-S-isoprenylcysteine O-methyltransferase [Coniochaeta hoffmannii]|uniref:Protein-S-isoprenylcysteine O-methyltransferase n=1 Tax=Coniochaeta hoffmannii TaxID=91930 RepID=A0AA38W4D5_9PEZI|nr:Protein-S-isoprenylcysteine O-methyltransferase [Coniochaeta hoffmannii]
MANGNSDDIDARFLHTRRRHDHDSRGTSPSPSDSSSLSPSPYSPHQPKSLSGIALRAFCLGTALATGVISSLLILLTTSSPLWRLPFFLAALSTFHFLEFWTTAAYNTPQADVKSFLLTANWPAYAVAHAAAFTECLLANVLFPNRAWAPLHSGPLLLFLGLVATAVGQAVRSAAMVRAGQSFNHVVQKKKEREHVLVTSGIYAAFRHPSYFGFFWWALGTQVVMGNVVCFCGYAAMLWTFFSRRIRAEEEFLVDFFGEDYVDYRKRVGTRIPFIP